MNLEAFQSLPILGILRGISQDQIIPLSESIAKTGLQAVEITMNTKDAPALIKDMKYYSRGKFMVGAGTVITFRDLDAAVAAGATFIVMPSLQIEVIRICVSQNIPVFPGAFTPTEMYKAWDMGATMVKVFPSSIVGPKYFSEIKGPFESIKLLACGGISKQTIGEFFKCGADAAAFGASIFKKEWLDAGEYGKIEEEINSLIQAYKNN
jgi:2-dehydro-3-deoxyphosphogluconate aldolase / (4S)-4-hydroxy-2-oxoglutarate aldolase